MRRPPTIRALAHAAAVALAGCAPGASTLSPAPLPPLRAPLVAPPLPSLPKEAAPLQRLPADARPSRYALALRVDPAQKRFSGIADITVELDRLRDVIWLHGKGLTVRRATVQPEGWPALATRWEQASPSSVAALRPEAPVGPGRVLVHVEYDAPFDERDEGLYVVTRGGDRYAFTQFEATDARRAFPCFDEPAFKAPFDLTVDVPRGLGAVSNTREVSRAPAPPSADGIAWERVTFARTERLPSYLVELAVGPFDIVPAPDVPPTPARPRPLALRGVTTRGRGRELAYALRHTGEIVTALESWFGSAYPYDKLDILAVPNMNGAMENAGAVTFAEGILLLDDQTSTPRARFNFAAVVGHELSHQWFGDLVTMPWWDDLWLNEAFATWMEPRVATAVGSDVQAEVHALDAVHQAMDADGLVSARKIRQEIADDDDIDSAFDAITYDKGGAVLGMFERWMGREVFQKGVRAYLGAHRFGSAGAEDLFAALSAAAGRDVGAPLRTFLDQPGLPFVEASLVCEGRPRLRLRQSRFLPLGSPSAAGSPGTPAALGRAWQIPVCARFADGAEVREACTLLTEPEGVLDLGAAACPSWVMPNADAAGYYGWSLAAADRRKLAANLPALRERERMSFARSVTSSYLRGAEPVADLLDALAPLAADPSPAVAAAPMDLVVALDRWLEGDPAEAGLRAFAGALFTPVLRGLGWQPKAGEVDAGRATLRERVIEILAITARDKAVRREAAALGRGLLGVAEPPAGRPGANGPRATPPPEIRGVVLQVAAAEGGAKVFDALVTALAAETHEPERRLFLDALGGAVDADLAARARLLELDARVRSNEVGRILAAQLQQPETRDGAWAFMTSHLDALLARMPAAYASALIGHGTAYCDRAHRDELERLFAPRIAAIEGGPRRLAGTLEEMSLCIARRAAYEPGARDYFSTKKKR
jgi:alanyl aminopeptidase